MQSAEWIALIDRIPPDIHDRLCFLTTSGMHINVQTIISRQHEVLILRGRISGSTDAGYTFMVPYDCLMCIYIQTTIKDSDVVSWFPEGGVPAELAPAAGVSADAAAPVPAVRPPVPPPPLPMPGIPVGANASLATSSIQTKSGAIPLPGKAAILERLRKRTSSSAQGTTPKPPTSGSSPGAVPKAAPAAPPPTGPAAPPEN